MHSNLYLFISIEFRHHAHFTKSIRQWINEVIDTHCIGIGNLVETMQVYMNFIVFKMLRKMTNKTFIHAQTHTNAHT